MPITDYRYDPHFPYNRSAFLVTGSRINDQFNRNLLAKHQTGYWIAAEGRIQNGDTLFLLLPNPNQTNGYPRNLYAGIIARQVRRETDNRILFTVECFHQMPPVNAAVRAFLNGHLPPVGSTVQTVWE